MACNNVYSVDYGLVCRTSLPEGLCKKTTIDVTSSVGTDSTGSSMTLDLKQTAPKDFKMEGLTSETKVLWTMNMLYDGA